jgi:hypothetical protein
MAIFSIDGEVVQHTDGEPHEWRWSCSCNAFAQTHAAIGAGYCPHIARAIIQTKIASPTGEVLISP